MVKLEFCYFNKLWRDWRTEVEEHSTEEEALTEYRVNIEPYNRIKWAKIDGKPIE